METTAIFLLSLLAVSGTCLQLSGSEIEIYKDTYMQAIQLAKTSLEGLFDRTVYFADTGFAEILLTTVFCQKNSKYGTLRHIRGEYQNDVKKIMDNEVGVPVALAAHYFVEGHPPIPSFQERKFVPFFTKQPWKGWPVEIEYSKIAGQNPSLSLSFFRKRMPKTFAWAWEAEDKVKFSWEWEDDKWRTLPASTAEDEFKKPPTATLLAVYEKWRTLAGPASKDAWKKLADEVDEDEYLPITVPF